MRDFYLNIARLSIPDNDTANFVWEKTKALFQNRRSVESALIKDIQLFHTFFGQEYGIRKITAQTQLHNNLGGDPIPAVQTVQITRLQKASPTYTVRTTQEIDRLSAKAIVTELMKHFGVPEPKNGQEVDDMFNNFTISDETEMDLQVKTGWPTSLQSKRSAKMTNYKQTETYRFTPKPELEAIRIHLNH